MPDNERQRRTKPPARWSKDVVYLRSYQFHESVTPAVRDFIKGKSSITGQLPNTHRHCVAIRPITDPTHPAHGQYGLFAISHIKPHTRILDYIGMSSLSNLANYVILRKLMPQAKYIVMYARTRTMISPFIDFQTV